eukprot:3303334-Pleurochrysis_carterae.AAC.1
MSTSAPRARSSASRVDGASPSPENVISARHAGVSPSACAGSAPAGSRASPARGGAATRPPSCCLPRADWSATVPAHTGAATVPPRAEPVPVPVVLTTPVRVGAGGASGRPCVASPRSSAPRGGGSGGGGGRCGWEGAVPPGAGGVSGGVGAPPVAGAGALGVRETPSPAPYAFSWARRAGTQAARTRASAPLGRGFAFVPLASRSHDGHALGPFAHDPKRVTHAQ